MFPSSKERSSNQQSPVQSTDSTVPPNVPYNSERAQPPQSLPTQKQIVDQVVLLEQQLHSQAKLVKEQNQMIQELRGLLNAKSSSGEPSNSIKTEPESPRVKLPMLEKFRGNRAMWDEWHLAAIHKLKKDGPAIGSSFDQFMYLFARLDGEASKMVSTTARLLSENQTGSGVAFLDYLNTVFGDPNKKARAQQQLYNLRQKEKEPFSSFLPRFETILATAGWSYYDDDQKISLLKNALSKEIRTALIGRNLPPTWAEFISFILTISSEIAALQQQFQNPVPFQQTRTNNSGAPVTYPHTMDWEPIKSTVLGTQNTAGQRATWVKRETLEFRRKKGLCVRCGNKGHRSPNCQFLPPSRPLNVSSMIQMNEEDERETRRLAQPDPLTKDANLEDQEGKEELL